ncbi:MAG TPA: PAS domain-containing sensor histidine kinase [Candidatus Gastranaerophilales bacterium]|nr:PAS domain-containing sensor histidine kinase [Candidatus Gastranaerophilales bacterium]
MKINSLFKKFSCSNNFDNYPDAVILIDILDNITHWNKKAEELFGYSDKEMLGRNIALIFDSDTEKIHEIIDLNKNIVLSSRNNINEEIYVEVSCAELPGQKEIMITGRNVTRNQKVIQKLLVEYEKASKICIYKSSFITGLSNDFKTPIHSLIGFSQGLLDGICGELNEKQLKYVTIMNKNANSLLDFVENFLELSRLENEDLDLNFKTFDIVKTINIIADRIKLKAEKKGLNLEIDLKDLTRKNIFSVEEMLSKSIYNILENAVKFTETGFVKMQVLHPDTDFVKAQGLEMPDEFTDKSYLLFKITDTGIGIAEEEIKAIFDEYSQTERNIAKKYGGTGFNLALTKKMLAHLGGLIWAETELGQGSTFNFIIPIERPASNFQLENFQEVFSD